VKAASKTKKRIMILRVKKLDKNKAFACIFMRALIQRI
jgi:hypothetical protein